MDPKKPICDLKKPVSVSTSTCDPRPRYIPAGAESDSESSSDEDGYGLNLKYGPMPTTSLQSTEASIAKYMGQDQDSKEPDNDNSAPSPSTCEPKTEIPVVDVYKSENVSSDNNVIYYEPNISPAGSESEGNRYVRGCSSETLSSLGDPDPSLPPSPAASESQGFRYFLDSTESERSATTGCEDEDEEPFAEIVEDEPTAAAPKDSCDASRNMGPPKTPADEDEDETSPGSGIVLDRAELELDSKLKSSDEESDHNSCIYEISPITGAASGVCRNPNHTIGDGTGEGPAYEETVERWDPIGDHYRSILNLGVADAYQHSALLMGGFEALPDYKSISEVPCPYNDGRTGRCWKGSTCVRAHPIAGNSYSIQTRDTTNIHYLLVSTSF